MQVERGFAGATRARVYALWLASFIAIGCASESAPTGNSLATPTITPTAAGSAATPAVPSNTPATGLAPVTTPPSTQPVAPPASTPANNEPAVTPTNPPAGQTPPSGQKPPETQEPAKPDVTDKPATTPPSSEGGFIRGPEPTAESAAKTGTYKVGQISMGFRNGPDFGGATIYYPEDAEPPFAMIVFCPGYLGTQASDRPWGPFMASHGIVFMNIDTNTTGDSVKQREAAELDALKSLQAEHTREGSPLQGKLANDRFGFMGWSMGGGGAWLNANSNPAIKSIITLAGHNATAGGARPLADIQVPTLMLAGTADTAILGLAMSQPVYDVIPDETPKMLYEVQGATHFDFNNPAYMNGIPARYALSWQKVFLEGDMRYYKFLMEKGPMASDFRTNLQAK